MLLSRFLHIRMFWKIKLITSFYPKLTTYDKVHHYTFWRYRFMRLKSQPRLKWQLTFGVCLNHQCPNHYIYVIDTNNYSSSSSKNFKGVWFYEKEELLLYLGIKCVEKRHQYKVVKSNTSTIFRRMFSKHCQNGVLWAHCLPILQNRKWQNSKVHYKHVLIPNWLGY